MHPSLAKQAVVIRSRRSTFANCPTDVIKILALFKVDSLNGAAEQKNVHVTVNKARRDQTSINIMFLHTYLFCFPHSIIIRAPDV